MSETSMRKADLILLLLHADGGHPIDGATRLQKLVFLVQVEVLHEGSGVSLKFEFRPDRFGPLAPELYDEIEFLESVGMVSRADRSMSITPKGARFLEKISKPRIPSDIWESVSSIKERRGREELDSLLEHVYREYPAFATKSEILGRVLGRYDGADG